MLHKFHDFNIRFEEKNVIIGFYNCYSLHRKLGIHPKKVLSLNA